MSPVRLHKDPGGAHVLRLPAFVRPREPGRYWHQPRSAHLHKDGRMSVTMWCGQMRPRVTPADLTDLVPVELRCGTCTGRRDGYEGTGSLVFRPVDHFVLPRKCPGGEDGTGHCLGCGRKNRYYTHRFGGHSTARHAPLPALAERWSPCPLHGWRDVRPYRPGYNGGADVGLRCWHWQCPYGGGTA